MALTMQHWAKTQEGLDVIAHQKPFCIGGRLFQGFRGVAITVRDEQITDDEMDACQDIDQTIGEVWKRRRLRLEGRIQRKTEEYDKRRALERQKRNEIMNSMRMSKELGVKPSPDDIYQIEQIDKRMERLRVGSQGFSHRLAKLRDPETAEETFNEEFTCDVCDAKPPAGHKSPDKWIRMHKMGKHRERKEAS